MAGIHLLGLKRNLTLSELEVVAATCKLLVGLPPHPPGVNDANVKLLTIDVYHELAETLAAKYLLTYSFDARISGTRAFYYTQEEVNKLYAPAKLPFQSECLSNNSPVVQSSKPL